MNNILLSWGIGCITGIIIGLVILGVRLMTLADKVEEEALQRDIILLHIRMKEQEMENRMKAFEDKLNDIKEEI